MKDDIKKEVTTIYDKMHKDTSNSLKQYREGINHLEKKSRRFWAIEGIKEAMFWCMCLGILFMISKEALNLWEIEIVNDLFKLLYPLSFMPIIIYGVVKIIEIMFPNKQ